MYGAQAIACAMHTDGRFENDVEMYGAQASKGNSPHSSWFENDVEMYGAQALIKLMKS